MASGKSKIITEEIRTKIYNSKLFDDEYYLFNFENEDIQDPLAHYITFGYKNGLNPSNDFDTNCYIRNNPDIGDENPLVHYVTKSLYSERLVKYDLSLSDYRTFKKTVYDEKLFVDEYYLLQTKESNIKEPLDHYINTGCSQGLNPSPLFNTNSYLEFNEDVKKIGINPLIHYVLHAFNSNRKVNYGLSLSDLKLFRKRLYQEYFFDDDYYLSNIDDEKVIDPIDHYMTIGYKKGYNPSKLFDTDYYLENNKDVLKSGDNPLLHYINHAYDTNRKIRYDMNLKELKTFISFIYEESLFDDEYYRLNYPNEKIADPLEHYMTRGYKENAKTSPYFDTECFLNNSNDIKKLEINPLVFYVNKAYDSYRKVVFDLNLSNYKEFRQFVCENELFDEKYYKSQLGDEKIIDSLDHYLRIGWKKDKNPSAKFITSEYFKYNLDVQESGKNPLLHYYMYGIKQNRVVSFGLTLDEYEEFFKYVTEEGLFDEEYYLKQVNEDNIKQPLLHYLHTGYKKGYDPSILFSTNEYTQRYEFVKENDRNPLVHYYKSDERDKKVVKFNSTREELKIFRTKSLETGLFDKELYQKQFSNKIEDDFLDHYVKVGSKQNKRPSVYFNQENYLKNNPDAYYTNQNPLLHYINSSNKNNLKINHDLTFIRYKKLRQFLYDKRLFDDEYYLSSLKNRENIVDPLEHYLEEGYMEGLNPSWFFNTKNYMKEHPELEEKGKNPLIDYTLDVMSIYNSIKTSGLFDEEYYLKQAGYSFYTTQDPIMHFITTGSRWGLNPNPYFSTKKYNEFNADVSKKSVNPFYHYISYGKREHRDAFMVLNNYQEKFDKRYNIQSCNRILNGLKKKISIVIPIYNAYDETMDCITSVLRNTHLDYELILIDDCSSDKRIKELLSSLESLDFVHVIRNKENMGFVKNVNLGMKMTKNDVVLLNSDTIVTPQWLSHMVYSAYLSPYIATVTPFSNSSDISIPKLGAENDFKFLNKSAYQLDKISINNGLESPTGNGFCLFIKRDALNELGYFDESFGRGYGEETDFTFRAYLEGWKNIRLDSVFVYHKRHASFDMDDSIELKNNNKKLLQERYDNLYELWDEFVESERVQESIRRINYLFKENKSSERILFVTGIDNQQPILDDIFHKISEEYDCYILAIEFQQIKIGVIREGNFLVLNKWIVDSKWDKTAFIEHYVNLLINLKIDLVYIKYFYAFYRSSTRDMSSFVELLTSFEIHSLYEATTDKENILESIDKLLHPMQSLNQLIEEKSENIDFIKKKLVVYTAIMGNYDNLVTPTVRNPHFDYICFTDNPDLKSNFWTIKYVNDTGLDSVRKARRIKILPHEYLKEYDYSLWIDANFDIIGDVEEYINKYSHKHQLLAMKHDLRDDIYEEMEACKQLEKDDPQTMEKQVSQYRQEGYPEHNGLIASGILFRNHHDKEVIAVMEDWFKEVETKSKRDQLSFNYVCWKNHFQYDENGEFYFKNRYFQRLLHSSDDLLELRYDNDRTNKILEAFKRKTTVIIPIYNAYEETKDCIESVIEHTNIQYDLLLIDDCSTDKRIKQLLLEYEKKDNITVIFNESNVGFVKNINIGLKNTANDVVILNSDTEVTPKWLQKLKTTAYSHDNIATVTPISNNAGAFSVPEKDCDNDIDEELGLNAISNIIEKTVEKDRLYVPTGNGFCMYIRRDAIFDAGFFDEIYGMGYCEENDYCMRLLNKNWQHLIDTTTYIYHKHNVSFGSKKEELFESNRQILGEKYPDYSQKLLDFNYSTDFKDIRNNIKLTLNHPDKKLFDTKRILYLIHEGSGGTLHTSIELMSNLPNNVESYVMTAGRNEIKLYKYSKNQNSQTDGNDDEFLQDLYLIANWNITNAKYTIKNPFNKEFRKIYFNVLTSLKIDLVHIRHLIRHSFDMPYVAKTLGIPVIMSFHDFYYVCPSHNLLDDNEKYCGGHCSETYSNTGQCDTRPGLNAPILKTFVHTWRKNVQDMFKCCEAFITTSQSAYDIYTEFYPELKNADFMIIEHGRDIKTPDSVNVQAFEDSQAIRILFPGHINVNKGGYLIKAIKDYDFENKLEFHYMGDINPKFGLEDVGKYHGFYKRSEFSGQVQKIKPHFIALLSIWPETYCHTLSESWGCGIPVITLDIGALGERVHKNGGGYFIENNPRKAYEQIVAMKDNPQEYAKKVEEITKITFKTTKHMADEYLNIYMDYINLQ